jgi:SAM-dependent methyltransferase
VTSDTMAEQDPATVSRLRVLNLGCGYQTSARCTNIDWSIPARLKGSALGRRIAPLVLDGERRAAYDRMTGTVLRHDLRKGIPAEDASVDAVYHSHLLEHLDREAVPGFLAEVRRVLKPGGVHRIVVPDLELDARAYLASLDGAVAGSVDPAAHEQAVRTLIEQMVRREAYWTAQRRPARRKVENALLGDARRRGETHQWMWDRVSLPAELVAAGFTDPAVVSNTESRIPDWRGFGLDETPDGAEYKPGSLYVEAIA